MRRAAHALSTMQLSLRPIPLCCGEHEGDVQHTGAHGGMCSTQCTRGCARTNALPLCPLAAGPHAHQVRSFSSNLLYCSTSTLALQVQPILNDTSRTSTVNVRCPVAWPHTHPPPAPYNQALPQRHCGVLPQQAANSTHHPHLSCSASRCRPGSCVRHSGPCWRL